MTHGAGAPVIAVDVGGTTIKAARIDAAGHAHPLPAIPTPIGADAVVQAVADAVARLREGDAAVEAVGVVVPGIVDAERGIGVFSENLLWRDAPLRDRISTATGLPVALDHHRDRLLRVGPYDVGDLLRGRHRLPGHGHELIARLQTGLPCR